MVEVARRQEETQIPPLRQAQETVPYAAEWMRIAFMQFLSNQSEALMGIKDFGEWKHYARGAVLRYLETDSRGCR